MNASLDITTPTGLSAGIDRLVAGDLIQADRQTLLLTLDSTPSGWRQCALAFLEDQAWRSAFGEQASSAVSTTVIPAVPVRSGRIHLSMKTSRYALAASLFVGLAALFVRFRSEETRGLANLPSPTSPAGHLLLNPDVSARPESDDLQSRVGPGQPLGYVTWADPGDGESGPRQIAVVAASTANEEWLQTQPPAIPDYVKAQWERRGYQVEENRRLVGLDLQDGRRVAVPVDEFAIDYVGRQPL